MNDESILSGGGDDSELVLDNKSISISSGVIYFDSVFFFVSLDFYFDTFHTLPSPASSFVTDLMDVPDIFFPEHCVSCEYHPSQDVTNPSRTIGS